MAIQYKKVDIDCMSDTDIQSFLMFKGFIKTLEKRYNPSYKIEVIPVKILDETYNNVIGFVPATDSFKICYNVNMMSYSQNRIISDAVHEFLHIWFRSFDDLEKYVFIKKICFTLVTALNAKPELLLKYRNNMPLLYENLAVYSFTRDIVDGEEVVCELASNLESPVREKVFNSIIKREIEEEDLDYIYKNL